MASDEKRSVHDGVTYTYSSDWIHRLENLEHWTAYWHQLGLMEPLLKAGDRLLEVGVGSGFVSNYLRGKGHEVTTVDIDPDKRPDICANIAEFECPQEYDALLAFEVFEHAPYYVFESALQRLAPNIRRHLFISAPNNRRRRLVELEVQLPVLGKRRLDVELPQVRPRSAHHFWELDDGTVSRAHFLQTVVDRSGFGLCDERGTRLHQFFAFTRG